MSLPSSLLSSEATSLATWAAIGVASLAVVDICWEMWWPVQPKLYHSAAASEVAAAAAAAGALEPWRSTFCFLGRYLSGHAQTIAYGLCWRAPVLNEKTHVRDRWVTEDGGTLELCWPEVPLSRSDAVGVALILPGLGGTIKGNGHAVMACAKEKLLPVVFHRRGDGVPLTAPRFNLFGDTADLAEAVDRARRSVQHELPVCLYATSAGTGCLVRYLGERGPSAPIAAAFANNPGYDIAVALTRCAPLYDTVYYLRGIKTHYLTQNERLLKDAHPKAYGNCEKATTLHQFLAAAAPFASDSTPSFGEYLLRSNPIGTAHLIRVPLLVLNADDDPICSRLNADDHISLFDHHPTAVLLRTPRGGHCGLFAGAPWNAAPWGHHLGARFIAHFARQANAASPAI